MRILSGRNSRRIGEVAVTACSCRPERNGNVSRSALWSLRNGMHATNPHRSMGWLRHENPQGAAACAKKTPTARDGIHCKAKSKVTTACEAATTFTVFAQRRARVFCAFSDAQQRACAITGGQKTVRICEPNSVLLLKATRSGGWLWEGTQQRGAESL